MEGIKRLCMLLLLCGVADWSASSRTQGGLVTITSLNTTEITLNPGDNFTLSCEGDTQLSWKYPDTADRLPKIELINQNGKFVSSLQLINVTYRDVGYYNCSSDNNHDEYSTVYLFVKDEENLITYTSILFVPINGLQHQDIIIPCKPTHPAVKVDLCHHTDTKLIIGENENVGVIRYDHKVGFTLENAQMRNNGFYYCCVLSNDSCNEDECIRTYSLDVLRHTDSVSKPHIDEMNPPHVTVGNNLTLTCKITVLQPVKVTLDWIVPNKTASSFIMRGSTSILNGNGHQYSVVEKTLTILNVKLEEEGNYICQATDHAGNRNSEKMYLTVSNK